MRHGGGDGSGGSRTALREALAQLRAALDACAVGQEQAKRALLVGLVAREHVLLEGPPGCAKSQLALALARAAGARIAAPVLHRDLRGEELLGDPVLERAPHRGGERLIRRLLPGERLDAEIWLLDDIARAPAGALVPLLHALRTRRALGRELALESVLATRTLALHEPSGPGLDPGWRGEFALQVRLEGLIGARRFDQARRLLDRGEVECAAAPAPLTRDLRRALQRAAAELPLGPGIGRGWIVLVRELRAGLDRRDADRLTDRAALRSAPALLRAHALLRGASRVEPADFEVASLIFPARLPTDRCDRLDAALETARRSAESRPVAAAVTGHGELAGPAGAGTASGEPEAPARPVCQALPNGVTVRAAAAGIAPLLRALEGEWSRGRAGRHEDPAGAPRSQRRLRSLDEALEADPVETWLYATGSWADLPRTWRRERHGSGAVAVLRDVSASMEGRLGAWAGEVVAGLVQSARRHALRMGYVEFDHEAVCFRDAGRFLHRGYSGLLGLAARRRAAGRTSYEAPLRAALAELRRAPGRERHLVLLTDGRPVAGDPEVRAERRLARRLGVRVHTVFIGLGSCPPVLDRLSGETRGLGFRARPVRGGRIEVEQRSLERELESCMRD